MKESALKTNMVHAVRMAGGYGRRIEDQYAVGVMDCVFILPACVPCFAEVKIFKGNVFGPTARQLIELQRIQKAGGLNVATAVIGWNGTFWIANPQEQINITNHPAPIWSGLNFVETLGRFLHE